MADATHVPASMPPSSSRLAGKKPPRRKGPNYSYIHRYALPIRTYPLPTLIPHNPLSVIAIALSYLTQLASPPKQPMYKGYFSSATGSIHVTEEESTRALWEMGFFGKGSLSRSEPTWLETRRRKGSTSEEVTDLRRKERKEKKLERAKKEKEYIDEKLREEKRLNGSMNGNPILISHSVDTEVASVVPCPDTPPKSALERPNDNPSVPEDCQHRAVDNSPPTPPLTLSSGSTPPSRQDAPRTCPDGRVKTVRFSPTIEAREFDLSAPTISPIKNPGSTPELEKVLGSQPTNVKNEEHLQLSLEEAFFLNYALGVLEIFLDSSDTKLSSSSLLALFRRFSFSPPRSIAIPAEPDDPFVVSYAVYHHFRSQGWVVRSGVKFAVDYLLYNRGPAFSHAEFAVVILPSYTDQYWSATPERAEVVQKETAKGWWWLHGINRVQAQVLKSLVLCYVDIPAPKGVDTQDISKLWEQYRLRTIIVKRWTPNRDRD